jgi:hypothetical protein
MIQPHLAKQGSVRTTRLRSKASAVAAEAMAGRVGEAGDDGNEVG